MFGAVAAPAPPEASAREVRTLGEIGKGRARRVGAHGPARKAARQVGGADEAPDGWRGGSRRARRAAGGVGEGSSPPPPWTAGSLASLIAAFSDPFSTKPTAGGARWALLFLVLCRLRGGVAAHPAQPAPRRDTAAPGGVTPAASATATGGATPQATSCSRAIFA